MIRRPDWPTLLAEYIHSKRFAPFEWGVHDCCLFAANCIEVMTGEDQAIMYRGTYSNEVGALRLLKELGGVVGIANKLLGPTTPVSFAQRGDVVLAIDEDDRESLAICTGDVYVAPGRTRLVYRPVLSALKAWKV